MFNYQELELTFSTYDILINSEFHFFRSRYTLYRMLMSNVGLHDFQTFFFAAEKLNLTSL